MQGEKFLRTKGQIISKGLFDIIEFSQNINEQTCRSSKNQFVCSFLGRIQGYQKSFRNHLTFSCLFDLLTLIHDFLLSGI